MWLCVAEESAANVLDAIDSLMKAELALLVSFFSMSARLDVQHEDVKLKAQGEDFAMKKQELLNAEKLRIRYRVCAAPCAGTFIGDLGRFVCAQGHRTVSLWIACGAPHFVSSIFCFFKTKPSLQDSKS